MRRAEDAGGVPGMDLRTRPGVHIRPYRTDESQLPDVVRLIEHELSEPYLIYTYRYFLHQWPEHCFLAYPNHDDDDDGKVEGQLREAQLRDADSSDDGSEASQASSTGGSASSSSASSGPRPVGVIISKLDRHLKGERRMRGYIAMLSVQTHWRGRGVGRMLVCHGLSRLIACGATEVVLETESDNVASLALYESLGFVREKRLHRFYLNAKDSFRLVLPVPDEVVDAHAVSHESTRREHRRERTLAPPQLPPRPSPAQPGPSRPTRPPPMAGAFEWGDIL